MAFTKQEEQEYVEYLNKKGLPTLLDELLEGCCKERPVYPVGYMLEKLEGKKTRCIGVGNVAMEELQEVDEWQAWCQGVAIRLNEMRADAESDVVVLLCSDALKVNRKKVKTLARCLLANGTTPTVATGPTTHHAFLSALHRSGDVPTVGIYLQRAATPQIVSPIPIPPVTPHPTCIMIKDYQAALYEARIKVADLVSGYADDIVGAFDAVFDDAHRKGLKGVGVTFDCMHGAEGPFAREVFYDRLQLHDVVHLRNEAPWGTVFTDAENIINLEESDATFDVTCGRATAHEDAPAVEERLFVEGCKAEQRRGSLPPTTDPIAATLAYLKMLPTHHTIGEVLSTFPSVTTYTVKAPSSEELEAVLAEVSPSGTFVLSEGKHVTVTQNKDTVAFDLHVVQEMSGGEEEEESRPVFVAVRDPLVARLSGAGWTGALVEEAE